MQYHLYHHEIVVKFWCEVHLQGIAYKLVLIIMQSHMRHARRNKRVYSLLYLEFHQQVELVLGLKLQLAAINMYIISMMMQIIILLRTQVNTYIEL